MVNKCFTFDNFQISVNELVTEWVWFHTETIDGFIQENESFSTFKFRDMIKNKKDRYFQYLY